MGWWKIDGGHVLGDDPLDVLLHATKHVLEQYEEEWGRRPTVREWEAMLAGTLLASCASSASYSTRA